MSNEASITGGQMTQGRSGALDKAAKVLLGALLLANLYLLVDFILYGYQPYFNSDSATKNLLAQEMYETGRFFPPEWVYVNGDLMVVFGHLFILPLLPFFDNGYGLHAASGLVSTVLILLGVWLVSGILSRSTATRMLCVATVASGVSLTMAESIFGQVSYGTVFYLGCFTLYFGWRYMNAQGRAAWAWATALFVLSVLLFWSNPQRALASYALPLAAAAAAYLTAVLPDGGARMRSSVVHTGAMLALLAVGAVVGIVLHGWALGQLQNTAGAGAARWLPFEGMADNLVHTFHGLVALLGGLPQEMGEVTTAEGLYQGIRLLAAAALLVLLPLALTSALKDRHEGLRYVAGFATASLALFLFLHVTTTIPDMADPASTARYLAAPVLFGLLLVAATVMDRRSGWVFRISGAIVLLVLATSAFSLPSGAAAARMDPRQQLVALLRAEGLGYGYASYWNAGALTVLSDHDVKVRQVIVDKGLPIPMRHLASDRWYEAHEWTGKTFLLLHQSEAASLNGDAMRAYMGEPAKTIRFKDYRIYVFTRNLAQVLPHWGDSLAAPLSLRLSEATPHQIGSFEEGGGGALVAVEGEKGFLHYGPYLRLKAGDYRVVFDVETAAADAPSEFGFVDVTSGGGSATHASQVVAQAGRQKLVLEFSLAQDVDDLELRVISSGAGRFALHGIEAGPGR